MPFGLSKKDKGDADLDSKKASLFGRSKSSNKIPVSSPLPTSSNPYAVPPQAGASTNPYAAQASRNDPYAPKSQTNFGQPPTTSFGNLSLNNEKGAAPPSYDAGPSAPSAGRYGREKSAVPPGGYGGAPAYGNQGPPASGYGGNPYGGGVGGQQQQSRYGAAGYGGLGRRASQETMTTEVGRNELFGDAASRAAANKAAQQQQGNTGEDSSYNNASSGYGDSGDMPGGYGSSGADRQLTAEEQEEEDVAAAKSEIRFIKQQDVASTRNARRIAEEAERTGRETLARLGAQGDRIHNTERNLDTASNHNRLAEEKARELKTLNRSMFAVHVANPFTANKREQAANAIALEKHQREREQADATRAAAYGSQQRQQQVQRDMNGNVVRNTPVQRNLADRAKYQFEADSEDDEMENEIDDNLDAIYRGAKTLNQLGQAMGTELDTQNKHIDRIIKKTDKVDDQIALNRARLDRIR